ncbi:TIGR04255 family protein [Mycobacterium uberis]|uniref:TIGR04255 family protein n=1 Tax=Mycobacterium uberis TaxID=2162698 RepID=UPI001FB56AAD|nr:TIGR04255 family protein [Mycobacterium uberis]
MNTRAIVVHTSAYTNFEAFCEIAMQVLNVRAQISSLSKMERISLRYVLEI